MKFLSFLFVLMFVSTSLFSDSLNTNRIINKADWYIHLDMETLLKTNFGKKLIAKAMEEPEFAKIKEVLLLAGIDPFKTAKSITVYGVDYSTDSWLLAYNGSYSIEKLVDLFKVLGKYELIDSNGLEVYYVNTDMDKFYVFAFDGVLYLSKKVEMINDHIQMMKGNDPSLKKDSKSSKISLNKLSFIGSAINLPVDVNDRNLIEINKYATKVMGGITEEQNLVKMEIIMETENADSTEKLHSYLKTVLGVLKVSNDHNQHLSTAINNVVINKVGNKLIIKTNFPSNHINDMFEKKKDPNK